ncbi:PAS domain-containing protein, partial [Streptomyces pinistramenti]|uniref:PAS domain-containing protein n=1 Tax=Streptomyces pinistramenti TaxID=2884812 RepID=UPI001D0982F3
MSSRPSRGAARLAAILDALPDALLLVNCNGTVVNANTIALETFEAPGTGLVGRGLLDLLPSFDSKRIPGSMRRRDEESEGGRTKPTRMVARRTDGTELLVEVTSANLEDGRTPYESAFEAAYADHRTGYTGDELLMLVVRDLTGTLDTETELARQQRQTEMILRAAAEGVVGVDSEGKVVLVNPSAAQILGYRASELGGQELHPLMHHSRADGSPLPWEETPLADTLRSGRKHRVRGQALWAKDGRSVSVDLTTAPVRDGDQLVGAVMTFTDRRPYDALAARHAQLLAVLEQSLRGPLEELTGELNTLASDPAGQLWPEANQILHHLAAGHSRMTTLVDNVLSYQRLDAGAERLKRTKVSLDTVVAAGVEGAIELIGPGRAQFAVHAPPIEATVDAERVAQALSHLIADVAGVDSTGRMPTAEGGGGAGTPAGQAAGARRGPAGDSTIVVAAAKRGAVVRIEVRGPYGGGDPVHEPLVRGIVRQHGGLMQTHKVPGGPGAGGSAYVLELPVSPDGTVPSEAERAREATGNETTVMPSPVARARGTQQAGSADGAGGAGRGGAEGSGGPEKPGGAEGPDGTGGPGGGAGPGGSGGGGPAGGGRPGGRGPAGGGTNGGGAGSGSGAAGGAEGADGASPTGRRRARHSGPGQGPGTDGSGVSQGGDGRGDATAGSGTDGAGRPAGTAGAEAVPASGRRRARQAAPEGGAQPGGDGSGPAHLTPAGFPQQASRPSQTPQPSRGAQTPSQGRPQVPGQGHPQAPGQGGPQGLAQQQAGGRRARRALAEAPERAVPGERTGSGPSSAHPRQQAQQEQQRQQGQRGPGELAPAEALPAGGARSPFALPPAAADQAPSALPALPALPGRTPEQSEGTGRRRARRPVAEGPAGAAGAQPG